MSGRRARIEVLVHVLDAADSMVLRYVFFATIIEASQTFLFMGLVCFFFSDDHVCSAVVWLCIVV